jgi:mRNA-degrading endonuclease YafQ of YafQ-DinJ toxin-antitoxin module
MLLGNEKTEENIRSQLSHKASQCTELEKYQEHEVEGKYSPVRACAEKDYMNIHRMVTQLPIPLLCFG